MNFITNIPSDRFDSFTKQHPKSHFAQSYEWGQFKSMSPEWDFDTVGLEDANGQLVAAALVLFRHLPVIKRPFIYIPRGYVIDFSDQSLLKAFTRHMKEYAKSKKAIFIKIDPDIKYIDRNPQGEPLPGTIKNDQLISDLSKLGYKHLGFAQDFESTIQPRYTFRLGLTPEVAALHKNCHSKTRYNLKIAQKRGIEIVAGGREDLKTFSDIMNVTGNRNGFLTRPLSYFEEMYDTLNPKGMCRLYLARLNTGSALEGIKSELVHTKNSILAFEMQLENYELNEKKRQKILNKLVPEEKKLSNLKSQLEEMQDLYLRYPQGITMSGILTLYYGNKAWYLYGASDDVYREFMPNYLIQWHALNNAREEGYEIYDFFGISGRTDEADPLHGLYRFKKGFGGDFTEFVGEFDLIVNPALYLAWTRLLPAFKRYKKKLRGRK